jgi:hypothetical protein
MFTLKLFLVLFVGIAANAKAQRTPNQDSPDTSCISGVTGKDYKIDFGKPDADDKPVLILTKADGKQLTPWYLPVLDSSVACRKLIYFPAQNILLVEMYEGQNGTVIVNKSRSLFVYKIERDDVTFLAQFPLEQTMQKQAEPIKYLVRSTYESKVLNGKVQISIVNELSRRKDRSIHSY